LTEAKGKMPKALKRVVFVDFEITERSKLKRTEGSLSALIKIKSLFFRAFL